MASEDQLVHLRRLDEGLVQLEALALKCYNDKKITDEDEDEYERLLRDLQRLYGRLRHLVGTPVYQVQGRNFDGFQLVLSYGSLSTLLSDQTLASFWQNYMDGAKSVVRQTIGKLEAAEQRGQLGVSPEVGARWKWLILPLEKVRQILLGLWAAATRYPDHLLHGLEVSLPYRIAAIVATVGTATFVVVALVVWVR